MKVISNTYMFAFYVFVAIIVFGSGNSQELKEDYTPVSNNNIEVIRTESNNEWGSNADPSY